MRIIGSNTSPATSANDSLGGTQLSCGMKFTPTETCVVTQASFHLGKTGAPNGNVTFAIYSDSAGVPNTLLGSSAGFAASTLVGSGSLITDTFSSGPTVTSGVAYWLVATRDASSNQVTFYGDASTPVGAVNGSGVWTADTICRLFQVGGQLAPITLSAGSFALTGQSLAMSHGYTATLAQGSYTLTGQSLTLTLFQRWTNASKNTTSFSNGTKHTSVWTNASKNTSTFTNQTKS